MHNLLLIARALGDLTRLRALMAVRDGELCLCQLVHLLKLAPSTVSKHMTLLVQAGLLECRKEGRWRFYRLPGPRARPVVKQALRWVESALDSEPVIADDEKKIRKTRNRHPEAFTACYRG
jgi:DNA-binding transcriptional ArsR family regulator